MSGLFSLLQSDAPPKWFRVLSKSGRPLGLGFQCPKCHFGYRHSAPLEIFHCGALEKQPLFTKLLPVTRIGGDPILPPNVFKVGDWD
jgi:hypothetical protein